MANGFMIVNEKDWESASADQRDWLIGDVTIATVTTQSVLIKSLTVHSDNGGYLA